ncbi:MAG: AEC family transporter [Armatimonadota bacterium]
MVLGTVFSIFLLLFLGYGTKKIKLLRAKDAETTSALVVNLMLPAFVFLAVYDSEQRVSPAMAKIPVIGFGMILLVCAIAYALGRLLRMEKPTIGGLILASAFGNTAFLGYPVITAAFGGGSALVPAALYDQFGMLLPLCTFGVVLASHFSGEKVTGRQLTGALLSPSILAVPVALVLHPVKIPLPVIKSLEYLAAGTVPLAMLTLGLSLSARSIKTCAVPVAVACVLKLAVLPALTWALMRMGGFSGEALKAVTMESAMPTAVLASIIAVRYKADGNMVAGVVFVSTLLGILSIPSTLMLLGSGR